MRKLFGTDGIRSKAFEYPMTEEILSRIGYAVSSIYCDKKNRSKILIGRDSRESGETFEKALLSGICQQDNDVYLAGIIPTPGISYLVSSRDFNAGIVISASHNPYFDNGIKIFDGDGHKLSDSTEEAVENIVFSSKIPEMKLTEREASCFHDYSYSVQQYTDFLKQCVDPHVSIKGLKLVIDCANGSTSFIAPELFEDFGCTVKAISYKPDGKNINNNCGSEYPQTMAQKVISNNADVGIAFDGDGDRLIAADENGEIVTGDQILAIFASFFKMRGVLTNNILVSTIMSNMGLGSALKKMGIKHIRTKVGDRFVCKEMIATGAVLGGEDSGHIILKDTQTTGDGIVAALKLLEILTFENKPLSELKKIMNVSPQILMNVEVADKPEINNSKEIMEAIKKAEKKLGKKGRVVVRYSGTQPICRVMVEGPSKKETEKICEQLSGVIERNIGKVCS